MRDALGGESEPGVFTVTFDPARVPISYPQTVTLRQDGQQILIDGTTSANGGARNAVLLRSESDPKGFLVDLVPGDGPDHVSGYAKLSSASDAGQAVLAVERVGEKIEAAGPAGSLASLQVVDSTPPPEPSVVSLTHPIWANTVPSIAGGLEPGSQSTAQLLRDEPVDLRKFPVLNFRYRIDAAATVQMAVRVNDVDWGFSLAGVPFEAWARGTDPEVQSARTASAGSALGTDCGRTMALGVARSLPCDSRFGSGFARRHRQQRYLWKVGAEGLERGIGDRTERSLRRLPDRACAVLIRYRREARRNAVGRSAGAFGNCGL